MRTIDDEYENNGVSYEYTDSTGIKHFRDRNGNEEDEYEYGERIDKLTKEMSFDGLYVWCGPGFEEEASEEELEDEDNWTPDEDEVLQLSPVEAYNAPTYEVSNLWLELYNIESEDDIDEVLRDEFDADDRTIERWHPLVVKMLRDKQSGKK